MLSTQWVVCTRLKSAKGNQLAAGRPQDKLVNSPLPFFGPQFPQFWFLLNACWYCIASNICTHGQATQRMYWPQGWICISGPPETKVLCHSLLPQSPSQLQNLTSNTAILATETEKKNSLFLFNIFIAFQTCHKMKKTVCSTYQHTQDWRLEEQGKIKPCSASSNVCVYRP